MSINPKSCLYNSSSFLINSSSKGGYSKSQFSDVANHYRALCHNVLGSDRMMTNPEFIFNHDIVRWINDPNDSNLSFFSFCKPSVIKFNLTDEQFSIVENKLKIFGNTTIGRGQLIKRTTKLLLWRQPKVRR